MATSTKTEPLKEKNGVVVRKLVRKLLFPCEFGDCMDCIGEFIRPGGPLMGTFYQCTCKHHNKMNYMREYARKNREAKKKS